MCDEPDIHGNIVKASCVHNVFLVVKDAGQSFVKTFGNSQRSLGKNNGDIVTHLKASNVASHTQRSCKHTQPVLEHLKAPG